MNIISRETIIKEKMVNVPEGELVLELLKLGETLGYENCIDKFSFAIQQYVQELLLNRESYMRENLFTYIMNVCYVVELYLRGYYNKENYIGYEEFLNIVDEGKTKDLIEEVHNIFILHINRLKKIIGKTKKKIPKETRYFYDTKELLKELERDISICERYPITSANLSAFYFGRYCGICGTNLVNKLVGFMNLEKEVYYLYNELYIMSKFDVNHINGLIMTYKKNVGKGVSFNLFEKVINNYLFASVYSDNPENLKISKVDAELLIREIKMGTLNAGELINQLIDKYKFDGYKAEYLKEYEEYLQKRLVSLKDATYFGELFIVTPPE